MFMHDILYLNIDAIIADRFFNTQFANFRKI